MSTACNIHHLEHCIDCFGWSWPHEQPPAPAVLEAWADYALARIHADVLNGTVPVTVTGFSDLHDYVDANMYLDHTPWDERSDDTMTFARQVSDILDDRIRAGVLRQ